MSVRVLLLGARLCRNFGGPSLLATTVGVLDTVLEDATYTFVSPTSEDLPLGGAYGVHVIVDQSRKRLGPAAMAKALLGLSMGSQETRELVSTYAEADIVVDIWGIGFADSVGSDTFTARALEGVRLALGKLFGKPVVKYTADLGPFESRWNRFFAKLYLQHAVELILARSDATRQRLDRLGVTTPIRVCPDTAFLLESHMTPLAEDLSRQKVDCPLVGLSVSHMAARQSDSPEAYLESMAGLADHIVSSIGAKIVLIPNELSPDTAFDDAHVAKEVWNRMTGKAQVAVVEGEYTAQQLKGIIQHCHVVVAARYHTIVASLSQGIPVLAIGWHAKYPGVMGLVGQQEYLCSAKSLQLDDLKHKFDDLWQSRDRARRAINGALPGIHEAILRGGEEVRLLLNRK